MVNYNHRHGFRVSATKCVRCKNRWHLDALCGVPAWPDWLMALGLALLANIAGLFAQGIVSPDVASLEPAELLRALGVAIAGLLREAAQMPELAEMAAPIASQLHELTRAWNSEPETPRHQ